MKDQEGGMAVKLARRAIDAETRDLDVDRFDVPDGFRRMSGAFVTLKTFPGDELRGCIGYPEPVFPLAEAILRAAQGACHDPRFPTLRPEELDQVVVEVSVLTPPMELKVDDRREVPKAIVIGRDGLIMERGMYRGLLLPQVPVEWEWDVTTFLEQSCLKAGLPPDMWLDRKTRIFTFQAEIFHEESPYGQILRERTQ
ncbi:MAG TPA: TIGR00296 family protein [Methanomassiliicoccales archaeon]|nr:TIGR00296 family protein [Methanomassiliicoccales archaeon]HPR97744.1 TIGR00296 family protein [Methanomassiliicoccales archaeon]